MRQTLIKNVSTLVAHVLGVESRHVDSQTHLEHDLGADSLDKVNVAMQLESEFGIDVSDEKVLDIKTVSDAAEIVEQQQESGRPT